MNSHITLIAETCERNGHHDDVRYALFKGHIPKVIAVAVAFHRKLPAGILHEDQDFIMIGLEALWECTAEYDPTRNPNFWGYAKPRVSGSMIDEIRSSDPVSRSNRDMLKKIECRRQQIEQESRREATFDEACVSLGIDGDKADELNGASSIHFISLDSLLGSKYGNNDSDMPLAEVIADENNQDPTSSADKEDDMAELENLLQILDPLNRSVVRLYFFSGLRLRDIASAMGLTESRASQILSGAIEKLRRKLVHKTDVFSRQCDLQK